MARRWIKEEEDFYRAQLVELYIEQNKTAEEIAGILMLSRSSVCKRLKRLNIPSNRQDKPRYLNRRRDITIPKYSNNLAEFFGILLGDGNLTSAHIAVTLGNKELLYANHVMQLYKILFGPLPKIYISPDGYMMVYLCSTEISRWLMREGMVCNKVRAQVDVPRWIFDQESYMRHFVRGFFDTDGSVYKLRFGIQLSFTNRSAPLLVSLQKLLKQLKYRVSEISDFKFYITRIADVERFFNEIQPRNEKHLERFQIILQLYKQSRAGIEVAKRDAL